MAERPSRKLSVLLHADVVDSTSLVQKNETVAHKHIQDTFRRFSEIINAYGGVPHEIRGDALVAEFGRASDAVSAALVFQSENAECSFALEDDIQPRLRIGISLGEVVIADNTVTGPGVVLAQRVEQLAVPGGVCITSAIHEAVPQRLPLHYADLGKRELKGFKESVQAYSVIVKAGEQIPPPEPAFSVNAQSRNRKRLGAVSAMVLLVLVVGGLALLQPWKPEIKPAAEEHMELPVPDKLSIAVLPFTNMSGDPEQEYFSDGMTEDLITDLSKLSGLFVIARNSSFAYKGKSPNARQVSRELGVRFLLEGSVRRVSDRVRINAQLIDAATGGHLWAERYDGSISNVFSVQDEVTAKIVSALAVQLTANEEATQVQRQTNNLQAYDSFLKGLEHYRRDTTDHYAKAMEYFQQAVSLDPEYSRAYAAMASIYWKSYIDEFYQVFNIGQTDTRELAQQRLELALRNPSSLAYQAASEISLWWRKYDEAISNGEKAIALEPNNASAHVVLANALIFSGRPKEALNLMDRAAQLDPLGQARYEFVRGLSLFGTEQYAEAAESLERARELNPEDWAAEAPGKTWCYPCVVLAATYGHLGNKEDGKTMIAYLNAFGYHRNRIPDIAANWPYNEVEDARRFSEGLRKAGVPD